MKDKKSPHGLIELRSDDILVFRPDLTTFKQYDIPVLEDLLVDFVDITGGVPRPYMCDNRHIPGLVNREEKEFINKHFGEFATHCAMITHSAAVKVLVNGYNAIFKPDVEIKLFKQEFDAVDWLLDKSK